MCCRQDCKIRVTGMQRIQKTTFVEKDNREKTYYPSTCLHSPMGTGSSQPLIGVFLDRLRRWRACSGPATCTRRAAPSCSTWAWSTPPCASIARPSSAGARPTPKRRRPSPPPVSPNLPRRESSLLIGCRLASTSMRFKSFRTEWGTNFRP